MADNAPPTPKPNPNPNPNPKLKPKPPTSNHLLLRALLTLVVFLLTPLLPSLFPASLSHSWELLHIVFVGLALSYGLFSRRYSPDHSLPPNSSDSYVSTLLHASSVFDADADTYSSSTITSDHDHLDSATKVQTWNSQYFRNKPVVVLANNKDDNVCGHKPLLLPVRSLKSKVSDRDGDSDSKDSNWDKVRNMSMRRPRVSNSNSNSDGAPSSGIVLPSPIPWRSRSGSFIVDNNEEDPRPLEDPDSSSWLPLSSKASPVKEFSAESHAKRSGDLVKKKAIYRSPPPPPPPPPPPLMPLHNRSSSVKLKSRMEDHDSEPPSCEDSHHSNGFCSEPNEMRKERSKVDYSLSSGGKSCRTVRSRSREDDAKEEESRVVQVPDELTRDWNEGGGDDFLGRVVDTSEDEDDAVFHESGEIVGSVGKRKEGDGVCASEVDEEGPDVDKKADEFIAKFREQIRLQRIESIKRSTGQFSRSNVG